MSSVAVVIGALRVNLSCLLFGANKVVVLLLVYVHGEQLWSCGDGHTIPGQAYTTEAVHPVLSAHIVAST